MCQAERSAAADSEMERLRSRIAELESVVAELRASEKRKRMLLGSLPQKVFFKDVDSRFISVNDPFAQEVGLEPDELVGKSDFDLYPAELAQKYVDDDQMVMRSRRSVTLIERHVVGGNERFVEVTKSPVVDDDGQVVGLMGLFTDVTERKQAQESIEQQARLLSDQADELEHRNTELSDAYANLQNAEAQLIQSEKMAAIGQLVAGLAHEINNPASYVLTNLTVIDRDLEDIIEYNRQCVKLEASARAFAPELVRHLEELREERSVDEAHAEVQSLLHAAKAGMLRIRDLVVNLRSFSRIDKLGDMELADINEGIEATLMIVKPGVPKQLLIETDLAELPLIECNLGHINQVLLNVVTNAVQAIGNKQGTIRIVSERSENGVTIRMRDDGPGIPAAIQPRVFDPFFTTKEVGKGTGLGLLIARRIVDAHQGRLELTSEIGSGTEFRIWLPIRQTTPPAAPSTAR